MSWPMLVMVPATVFLRTQYTRIRKGNARVDFLVALKYLEMCAELGDEECQYWLEDIERCIGDTTTCDAL